ncbi:transcription antitermination factor NusB [candidate division NPL-UPA2 bacterium Unc8]|uniref:Transcription antitermination protein NusB n=1 Tax=candidate division NPL-UPA2 bacterium Unc8 TaxID=1980939 RepID=A0A399FZ69_UNCN2|nr:N utilization substance protein B [Bacillota bacterium]MBT9138122.1 N utilization substance protein B [Bacillota bacterium]MBT9146347.1 N utilization substance protein B [Bacillota bacterium]RII00660.1 MAG: transcription antitermination factor NusB [candidate division NPL-UPA2 bacterium Unc8]
MGRRRQARELALQALYEMEFNNIETTVALTNFWKSHHCGNEVREFADKLINGTKENLRSIDATISSYADNWELKRMAVVDKNILRYATYELLFMDDIPPVVTINEAVEIAKKFSTEDSGGFINGILDRIKKIHYKDKNGN